MGSLIKLIGCVIFSLAMYAIPILATCSFWFNWYGGVKFVLVVCALCQLTMLMFEVADKADGDE